MAAAERSNAICSPSAAQMTFVEGRERRARVAGGGEAVRVRKADRVSPPELTRPCFLFRHPLSR
jgi:hypothetical protein